jgi:hypothetical protein
VKEVNGPDFDPEFVQNKITEQQISQYIRRKFRKSDPSPYTSRVSSVETRRALPFKARVSMEESVI